MPFAEKLEIVQISAANVVESLINLNDDNHFLIKSGSFKVTAPVMQRVEAADQRRWGGSRQMGSVEENGTVASELEPNTVALPGVVELFTPSSPESDQSLREASVAGAVVPAVVYSNS